jgi:hypothetical protein
VADSHAPELLVHPFDERAPHAVSAPARQHRERLERRDTVTRGPGLLRPAHVHDRVADRLAALQGDHGERVRLGQPLLVQRAPRRPRVGLATHLAEHARQLGRHLGMVAAERLPQGLQLRNALRSRDDDLHGAHSREVR